MKIDSQKQDGKAKSVIVEDEQFELKNGQRTFKKVGSTKLYKVIMKELKKPKVELLVFIPGFNYSFAESIGRAGYLAHIFSQGERRLVPFVFSWPSNGKLSVSDYRADRWDAQRSGRAIARAYAALLRFLRTVAVTEQCHARLHLLAHSMGVYALRHAVVSIASGETGYCPVRLFDTAVIAGGDDDVDTLNDDCKLGKLRFLTKRLDVYYNQDDKPVRISDDIAGTLDRLGAYGPADPSIIDTFGIPVSLIDCHHVDVWGADPTLHQYYRMSEVVIEDIRDVFRGIPDKQFKHRKKFDHASRSWVLHYPSDKS